MRISRRMIAVAATAAATAGLVLGGAASAVAAGTPAATAQAYVVFDVANDGPCGGLLQSAQVTAGGPADVSVYIENQQSGKPCTGWLERSVNKGKSWTVVSPKIAVPSSGVVTWAKSADYADGPGRIARVCARAGSGPAVCSGAMGLRASAVRDTGAAVPVSYVRRQVSSTGSVFCTGRLSSTTAGKTATSYVHAYLGDFAATAACTGVLESSANGGKTWLVVSALAAPASHKSGAVQTAAYGPRYPDGKGRLARVCITAAGKSTCTRGW
jgi:hypothetical protein